MSPRPLCLVLLLALVAIWIPEVQAAPLRQSPTLVVICYDNPSCGTPILSGNNRNADLDTLNVYTQHVLANEWPGDSDSNAFKAGAIAIRTFTYRNPGCGAYVGGYSGSGISAGILDNRSQTYRYGGLNGTQRPITSNHTDAESQTSNVVLRRNADDGYGCAKYKSDTGNPTADDGSGQDANTLLSVPDPADSNRPVFEPPWSNSHRSGMSQNGTVAWRQGAAGVRWNYCQMLTHYYTNVKINGCGNERYRWVWLDVGNTIVYDGVDIYSGGQLRGGDEYYGPVFNLPDTMEMGQNYTFGIHLQNTSTVAWQQSGSSRTRIGLYWDGNRNSAQFVDLDENMDPGEDDPVSVTVSPPSTGTHCLTVDLNRSGNWFSSQSSPSWPVLNKCVTVLSPDTTPPSNPTNQSGSHNANNWSGDNTIEAQWSGASDNRTPTNQLAYSIEWTTSPSTIPDTIPEPIGSSTVSSVLSDGYWYLHIRTRDNAGNWANDAAHFGPFLIDTTAPVGSHSAPEWWLTPDFTVTWTGMDLSGLNFDFDYALNSGPYQDWFTTTTAPGSRVYDRGANVNDVVHIRACITDLLGHPALPPCTYSHTAIHITPYLATDPASLSTCFALADTAPQTGTMLIKNQGPGSLDWTATAVPSYLTLSPTTGTNVASGFPATMVYTLTNPAVVGQHTAVITVSSSTSDVGNNPATMPVTIRVVPDQCIYDYYFPVILKNTSP